MSIKCDVHPDHDMVYSLESSDGNCYYACQPYELIALLNVTSGTKPTPCGHGAHNLPATWPVTVGLLKAQPELTCRYHNKKRSIRQCPYRIARQDPSRCYCCDGCTQECARAVTFLREITPV